MVQLSTTAALLTVAQVALYANPALGGPIDLTGTQLEARSGAAGRIAKEMGKDHAMSKAQDLALQWKDQALNKNKPNRPSMAQVAQQAAKEKGKPAKPAPQGPKPPAMPSAPKKPSVSEQAKQAMDATKKHPVQSVLKKKQRRELDFDLEARDFEELYDLVARDLYFDELEARSGAAGRIAKEMGKDHAMSKAQDLALQWKDQALNKNKPNRPSMAQVAQQAAKEKGKPAKPAPQGPKPPAMPPAPKKPSVSEQAKQAMDATKKHPVQTALKKKQRRAVDFDLEARDFEEFYDLVARDLYFDELEARSGTAGRIIKEMGKDHAMSKAQDLALQWKDQALNKNKPNRPSMAQVAQQAMKEKGKNTPAPAPNHPKPPAMPHVPKGPTVSEQAKQALDAAKKHPVQAALKKKQRRELDFELQGRDIDELYDLVARDLYFDMLEARNAPIGSMSLQDLD